MDDQEYVDLLSQAEADQGKIQTEATRRCEVAGGELSPVFRASQTMVNALQTERATINI